MIMGIWGIGNAMLIFLAGLQGVPTDLYDAAKVDGANGWQTFRKVTFPMISPVVFYNLVLGVVFLFQYFLVPLVVNQGTGRPGGDDVLQLVSLQNVLYLPEHVVWLRYGLVALFPDTYRYYFPLPNGSSLGVLRRRKQVIGAS